MHEILEANKETKQKIITSSPVPCITSMGMA